MEGKKSIEEKLKVGVIIGLIIVFVMAIILWLKPLPIPSEIPLNLVEDTGFYTDKTHIGFNFTRNYFNKENRISGVG